MTHKEILSDVIGRHLIFRADELRTGDWVYTPDAVFKSNTPHNIFQFDERMDYSICLGHEPKFYKLYCK